MKKKKPELTEAKAKVNVEAEVIPLAYVEIIKVSGEFYWYNGLVGYRFLVTRCENKEDRKENWDVITERGKRLKRSDDMLLKKDCKILLQAV